MKVNKLNESYSSGMLHLFDQCGPEVRCALYYEMIKIY